MWKNLFSLIQNNKNDTSFIFENEIFKEVKRISTSQVLIEQNCM